jgi:hypothetical protein
MGIEIGMPPARKFSPPMTAGHLAGDGGGYGLVGGDGGRQRACHQVPPTAKDSCFTGQ